MIGWPSFFQSAPIWAKQSQIETWGGFFLSKFFDCCLRRLIAHVARQKAKGTALRDPPKIKYPTNQTHLSDAVADPRFWVQRRASAVNMSKTSANSMAPEFLTLWFMRSSRAFKSSADVLPRTIELRS